jgi:DNA-binding transcriptional regulator of glucitol operon
MANIYGTDLNDTLQGTAGDDAVFGRHGVDTLSLAAQASTDATFSINSQGRWVVTSAAGRDTLSLVEQVQFSDALILLGENETRVNTTTLDSQFSSAIATLADGGYVVTWTAADGSDGGIFAQRYAADGTTVGMETQVNTTTGNTQDGSAIAALADGGYVVTWTSWTTFWNQQDDTYLYDTSVYLQRYAADGAAVGGETRINTTTDDFQSGARAIGLPDGGYLVTWSAGNQDGSGNGIYAQRYAGDGTPIDGEKLINTTILGEQYNSTMAVLADGGYVIAWSSIGQDGSAEGVIAQRYAADGSAVGGETIINSTTAGAQTDAKVVGLAGGDYAVIWSSHLQDGSGWGVYSQRYAGEYLPDGSAIPIGVETRVNTTMVNSQFDPAVAALVDGGYVVTWTSNNQDVVTTHGIYAQRYAADGSAEGAETLINVTTSGNQYESAVAALADGGYVVTWTSQAQDGPGSGVYSQRYDANGLRAGHPTLTGGSEDNVLRVSASQGVEIDGGAGNDTLAGGSQGDILRGGSGADTFEFASSGNGIDRIMDFTAGDRIVVAGAAFAEDPTAGNGTSVGLNEVQVSAANGITKLFIGTDATPGADVVIELTGTWTADQLWSLGGNQIELASPGVSLTGTTANESLVGGVGNDTIDARTGTHTMAGGLRNDTYIVDNKNDVVVELADEGTDQVLASCTYTLAANVENLTLDVGAGGINATGNALNNVIVGNGAANIITGGLGADTLTGGAGADRFTYTSTAESSASAWDVIVDFVSGVDRIDLSKIDANVVAGGNQVFTFNENGAPFDEGNATGQVRFDSDTHKLYASTNADATAEIVIQLTGVETLTAADIVL